MKNKEAIEILCSYGVPVDEKDFQEALNVAIEGLKHVDDLQIRTMYLNN